MFTGLIQAIGKVVKYDGSRLWVAAPFRHVKRGESIAIDGVCLTVAAKKGRALAFDVGKETQRVTTLGQCATGSRVNLERALRMGDRVGGHWVSGHVEMTGHVRKVERLPAGRQGARQNWWYTFSIPKALKRFVVSKGSLTVDGISLTVAALRNGSARIMIIPHTLSHTTLRDKKVGDRVNLEPDLLAKYAVR